MGQPHAVASKDKRPSAMQADHNSCFHGNSAEQ